MLKSFLTLFVILAVVGCSGDVAYETYGGKHHLVNKKTGEIISETDCFSGLLGTGTACSETIAVPIVDDKVSSFDVAAYQTDLADCRRLAFRVKDRTLETAVGAAAVGAATGAAVGATVGIPATGAAIGAAGSGVPGIAAGYGNTQQKKTMVLVKCLEGRGYSVLGVE